MNDALVVRRRLLAVAAVLAVLSEIFAAAGIGTGIHETLYGYVLRGDGFFSACLLASGVIYATARPENRREFLGAGIVGELLQAVLRGHNDYLHNAGAMFGVVALLLAGREYVRARNEQNELLLSEVAMFPALLLAAALPLELTVTLHPTTLDGRAFLLDQTLFGGQPAWAVGRLFAASKATLVFEALVYVYLPVAAAGVYVLERRAGRKSDLQVAFLVVGIIGIMALHLAPIAGPNAFRPLYPRSFPPTDVALQSLYIAGTRWRNCIPSMHTTWALLVYWHARQFGARGRAFGLAWLGTTIIAMLGLGEHFLVDVAVSTPFAVAMRALFLRTATKRARVHAIAGGLAFFAMWLLLLRGPTAILGNAWLMRPFALAGVAVTLFLETRLHPTETPEPLARLDLRRTHGWRLALGFSLGIVLFAVGHWVGVVGLAFAFLFAGDALALAAAGVGVLVAAYGLFSTVGVILSAVFAFLPSGLFFYLLGDEKRPSFVRPSVLITAAALVCGALAVFERHILALIAGSSFYAHASMSAVGLFGLAIGAQLRIPRAWALGGVVLSAALMSLAWPYVPPYFAGFHDFVERPTFATSEVARFVAIALCAFPPAIFAGAALARGGIVSAGGGALGMLLATLVLGRVGVARLIDASELAGGENVYFAKQGYGQPIAVADDAHAWTTVNQAGDRRTILTNGKFAGDEKAEQAFAEIALLHVKSRGKALVAGVGTGKTVAALEGFSQVTVVDPAPGAERFANEYFGAKVHVDGDDPRAALAHGSFDLVLWETPTMWFSGATELYSLSTYSDAAHALGASGVFQQWIQIHRIDRDDLGAIFATIHQKLPKIWLYVAERQGIVIACAQSCEPASVDARLLLDPAGVERFLATMPNAAVTRALEPWLELHAPRSNMRAYDTSLRENEDLLETFAGPARPSAN